MSLTDWILRLHDRHLMAKAWRSYPGDGWHLPGRDHCGQRFGKHLCMLPARHLGHCPKHWGKRHANAGIFNG